jgi:hypothetical protein
MALEAGDWMKLHYCSVNVNTGKGNPILGMKYKRYELRASLRVIVEPMMQAAYASAVCIRMRQTGEEESLGEIWTPSV